MPAPTPAMAQPPSTPVKVPSAAANYTPATLDPDLRSQINTVLLRDGHIAKIHEALLHALNSDASNWPTAIQSHALALMRSGDATTYPALLRRVLDDVRAAAAAKSPNGDASRLGNNGNANNSAAASATTTTTSSSSPDAGPPLSLALPDSVLQEALRVTRESLEAVCEIEEADA